MRTLTVQFHQFFYLLNVGTKGGVVLLPSVGHAANLQIGSGSPFPLHRAQVDILRWPRGEPWKRQVCWGEPTKPPGRRYLVHSEEIFGRQPRLKRGLVSDPVVPETLNARVVLSGGTFTEEESSNVYSRGDRWTFYLNKKKPPRKVGPRALTDRVRFEMPLDDAWDYALALTAGGCRLKPELDLSPSESTTVTIVNRDVEGTSGDPTMGQGFYCLVEYDHLHDLLEITRAEQTHPVGDYSGSSGTGARDVFGLRDNGEPVCGGEQGDCPDPPDPEGECEPPGTGGP